VLSLHPGPQLTISSDRGVETLHARHVLLCTGVRESSRVERLIGGTKPGGILTAGALQSMVYLKQLSPFRRPVILGSELVSFSSILTCRHMKIRPVAMIEPGKRPVARWPAALFPRLQGIPLFLNTEVVAVEGLRQVEAVIVQDGGGKRALDADGLIVSGRFRPEASLLKTSHLRLDPLTGGPEIDQYGRCSDPCFFAAGNLLRPAETAGWSWAEGRAVARTMHHSLVGQLPPQPDRCQLTMSGDALRFVVPQRIAPTTVKAALPELQIRVNRPLAGHLDFMHEGACIASVALKSRPERRITIDLDVIPVHIRGAVELTWRAAGRGEPREGESCSGRSSTGEPRQ
jgi:hypothetical protein